MIAAVFQFVFRNVCGWAD